jgi:hypothetical protein
VIEIDAVRHHNEKLKSALEPHVGEGDWVYALSSWHPQPSQREAAVAETSAWALILFKTKQTELIFRARALFHQLLKLQDEQGLFPRYLHELYRQSCPLASYRVFLVMKALRKWHEAVLGESLIEAIDQALLRLTTQQAFKSMVVSYSKDSSFEKGVMPSWLARVLWTAHVLETEIDSDLQKCLDKHVSYEGLKWLEKPKGMLPTQTCILDIWQSFNQFNSANPPKILLSHLWSSLLHFEGKQLLFQAQPQIDLFRNLPLAKERRGYTQSCFLLTSIHPFLELRAFATYAKTEGSCEDFHVMYDPSIGLEAEEDYPWLEVIVNASYPWRYNQQVFSALKASPGQVLKIQLKDSALALELISTQVGHWRQKPNLRKSVQKQQSLYFLPADLKTEGKVQIKIIKAQRDV